MLTFSEKSFYTPKQQAELALQTLSLADPLRTVHPICEAGSIMGKPWFQTTMGHEFGQEFDVTLWDELECNLYVSVNGFNSINSRKQANLRCLNDLFFDLDMEDAHRSTATPDVIEKAKRNALAQLADTIEGEELPRPTMVVWTGRGLQLHYVLDKSMSYRLRTGAVNHKGIHVLEKTRTALDERMQAFCRAVGHGFTSDLAVSDLSRICRIPGSINQAASAIYGRPVRAELLDCEGPLWPIAELDAFLGVARPGRSRRENPATERQLRWLASFVDEGKLAEMPENVTIEQADVIIKRLRENIAPVQHKGSNDAVGIAKTRMLELTRLQKLRTATGREAGHRHIMAFLYMNSAMSVVGIDAALNETQVFNTHFAHPLKESEITPIYRTLAEQGHPYRFNFQTICEKLELDAEEEALFAHTRLSNGVSNRNNRKAKREQTKEETAAKKRSRNELIAALANEGKTYQEIAQEAGCSRRTVCAVLADAGYRRNDRHAKECATCPEKEACPFVVRDSFKPEIESLSEDDSDNSQVLEKCKKLSRSLRLFGGSERGDVEVKADASSGVEPSDTGFEQSGMTGLPNVSFEQSSGSVEMESGQDPGGG